MMKRWIVLALALALWVLPAQAADSPPAVEGQNGRTAVVLCQTLTVREQPGTAARAVRTLRAGDTFATQSEQGGWYDCYLSGVEGRVGWVSGDYVAVDCEWYITNPSTPVYAWNDTAAYRVGLLDGGQWFPILKKEGDWLLIALRGAAGWVYDPGIRQAQGIRIPEDLDAVVRADLMAPDYSTYALTDEAGLAWIRQNFSIARHVTATKCPFDAVLNLTLSDGRVVSLDMATDSCRTFRTGDGEYYDYGAAAGESAAIAQQFWALFGLDVQDLY